jgi:hypothetical protein
MGLPGLVRVCLRDKQRRVSGLARPWRVAVLLAALEADPEMIGDLLLAAQRFALGHPFATAGYDGRFGSVRRIRIDPRYLETPGGHGVAVFDLEARRVRLDLRGTSWRRTGWLYYHDGETFTRRRVSYRIAESWLVTGLPEDHTAPVEWNEAGPEPFAHLLDTEA